MKVIRKDKCHFDNNNEQPLKLLISHKEHGAVNCQAGMAVLQPGQRLPETGYSQHASEEIFYILSGKVRVETDRGSEIVETGDLVFMPGGQPHLNVNIAEEETKILWFVTPLTVPEN
ncbi:Cupin domain-containing protein [Desulfotomaculum arcticum]|uniref:Cupin domain-containing protein n=1 Tax=Desulfotruncus arcticus DSM 17038 TaxID=1121424 RepID=A0A1I2RCC5_9FIRM|nr:cupin domain-containing protein [Desulfotruncus arcticus]SFG38188.1 Cupin domain-containing protein [Desulfotomaculum arcticum] [Desulfotruncus arcticus DSM 17038]